MSSRRGLLLSVAVGLALCATGARAQMPNPYGPPISLEIAASPVSVQVFPA